MHKHKDRYPHTTFQHFKRIFFRVKDIRNPQRVHGIRITLARINFGNVFWCVSVSDDGLAMSLPLAGILCGARLRMLRSGHSHEDVDQTFGALAGHLSRRARRATGPHQFRDIIQNWLDTGLKRPFEPKRYAVLMDQVRDWLLVANFCVFCVQFSFE